MSVVDMTQDELLLSTIQWLKDGRRERFLRMLDEIQPYDMARLYEELPQKHRERFVHTSTPYHNALLLQELDAEQQSTVLKLLGVEKSKPILGWMETDDLTAMLREQSVEELQMLLAGMKEAQSQAMQRMMEYPPESAGGIMTDQYVYLRDNFTVREAVEKVKAFAAQVGDIYYMYVLDDQKRLVGVVSQRDLLLADEQENIAKLMYRRVVSVPVHMDQEEVAKTIERYDFIAVPVVDHEQRMVGIVTVDDIIDVLIQEANEDIEKLAASGKNIDFKTPALTAAMRRLPWLISLLFLGLLSGSIIAMFESTIGQLIALTYFMPMIAGMTGNTGTQSLAIVIRGIASVDLNRTVILRLLFRELRVSLLIGLICGTLIFITGWVWQDFELGLVVGSSLLATLIIGTMAGTMIPLVLHKFNIDPAIASGPLITTLNDLFSLLVYFGLATIFLQQLLY